MIVAVSLAVVVVVERIALAPWIGAAEGEFGVEMGAHSAADRVFQIASTSSTVAPIVHARATQPPQ